jgi:hypothetical protein
MVWATRSRLSKPWQLQHLPASCSPSFSTIPSSDLPPPLHQLSKSSLLILLRPDHGCDPAQDGRGSDLDTSLLRNKRFPTNPIMRLVRVVKQANVSNCGHRGQLQKFSCKEPDHSLDHGTSPMRAFSTPHRLLCPSETPHPGHCSRHSWWICLQYPWSNHHCWSRLKRQTEQVHVLGSLSCLGEVSGMGGWIGGMTAV